MTGFEFPSGLGASEFNIGWVLGVGKTHRAQFLQSEVSARSSSRMPAIRSISSLRFAGTNRSTMRQNHAPRISRLSRRYSSMVERNVCSFHPNLWKKADPSSGANRNGAFPFSSVFPHERFIQASNRGLAMSVSHQCIDG